MTYSALYTGELMHARNDEHARRAFRYPVYVAALDLDELPALGLRLLSYNRTNLFAVRDRDYACGAAGLRAAHRDLLAANALPAPHAVRLITNLRTFGYVFNPVSFFLGYDAAGDITSVVAEVNNTYGGRKSYVLGPRERIAARDPTFRHVRELFVSPFLHGPASYDFRFGVPLDGDRLSIGMRVTRPTGETIFVARLAGTRRPLTDRVLAGVALRYPLMTAQVIGLIYLEALKLRLAGVLYRRPGRDHRPLV